MSTTNKSRLPDSQPAPCTAEQWQAATKALAYCGSFHEPILKQLRCLEQKDTRVLTSQDVLEALRELVDDRRQLLQHLKWEEKHCDLKRELQ